jgi:hypothetical protein
MALVEEEEGCEGGGTAIGNLVCLDVLGISSGSTDGAWAHGWCPKEDD